MSNSRALRTLRLVKDRGVVALRPLASAKIGYRVGKAALVVLAAASFYHAADMVYQSFDDKSLSDIPPDVIANAHARNHYSQVQKAFDAYTLREWPTSSSGASGAGSAVSDSAVFERFMALKNAVDQSRRAYVESYSPRVIEYLQGTRKAPGLLGWGFWEVVFSLGMTGLGLAGYRLVSGMEWSHANDRAAGLWNPSGPASGSGPEMGSGASLDEMLRKLNIPSYRKK